MYAHEDPWTIKELGRLHPSLDVGAQPLKTLVQAISARRARRLGKGGVRVSTKHASWNATGDKYSPG